MQSIFSRALVAILWGLIAMNAYLIAIEPLRADGEHRLVYTLVVGICAYLIAYTVLSKSSRSHPHN